jgi:hypothetical protein
LWNRGQKQVLWGEDNKRVEVPSRAKLSAQGVEGGCFLVPGD